MFESVSQNNSKEKTLSEEFILAIDTASYYPSASICLSENFEKNNNRKINALKTIKLFEGTNRIDLRIKLKNALENKSEIKQGNTSLKNKRYDAANFLNQIINLCNEVNCKPHQIKKLAVCFGPGAFSSIRIAVVLSRILKKLNQDIQVYNFDLLYLLLQSSLKVTERITRINTEISFCLRAGLKGFFKTRYVLENEEIKITQKTHLVEELQQEDQLYSQEENEICLSELMLDLVLNENPQEFELKTLDEFQAHYGREASVTKAKGKV
ncbi:MAG: hypothetical protein SFU25_07650 [Candidatus Caenarcaniphilales bacterium]|nr:hypothetical protein [Candidatus Caenarcaniphilales bacterium]